VFTSLITVSQIEKIFNRKNQSTKNQAITPLVSETAEAYLRSSAATGGVPLKSRFNMMIKDNLIPLRAALAKSGVESEFLGPQLQVRLCLYLCLCLL
jgi:hypothetical protein